MRRLSIYLIIFIFLFSFINISRGWLFGRRRGCTPCPVNIVPVNTNPNNLDAAGSNICYQAHVVTDQKCSCGCDNCIYHVQTTHQIRKCCEGYGQTGTSCDQKLPCHYFTLNLNVNHDAGSKRTFQVGESVSFTCQNGYERSGGSSTITCVVPQRWNNEPLSCRAIPCREPDLPANAVVSGGSRGSYDVYTDYSITCATGYARTGGGNSLHCNFGGYWSVATPIICKPVCFGLTNMCRNGGVCVSPDNCQNCNEGFYSPKCDPCPKMNLCSFTTCHAPDPHSSLRCKTCLYDYGPGQGKAYEVNSDGTACLKRCSWRDDSNLCYPGTCGLIDTCQCAAGFGTVDSQCDTIISPPHIPPGYLIFRYGGSLLGQQSWVNITEELEEKNNTIYSNARQVSVIEIKMAASFVIQYPEKPPYVKKISTGLKSYYFNMKIEQNGAESILFEDAPTLDTADLRSHYETRTAMDFQKLCPNCSFSSGDKLRMNLTAQNGGYMDIKNFETNSNHQRYFHGLSNQREVIVIYDHQKPVHCSRLKTCNDTPSMELSKNIMDPKEPLSVSWHGWIDETAGIEKFEIDVIEMHKGKTGLLIQGSHVQENYRKVYKIGKQHHLKITLPTNLTAVYAIQLTVCDSVIEKVSNCEFTRRFLLVDNGTTIETNPKQPIRLTGEVNQVKSSLGGFYFTSHSEVTVNWNDHFENKIHHRHGLLHAIRPWPIVDEDPFYDHTTGTRSISAIPNTLGIVKFNIGSHSNADGIVSSPPDIWNYSLSSEHLSQNVSVDDRDGYTTIIWVRAFDIAEHSKDETVSVHYDQSAPLIQNFTRKYHGRTDIIRVLNTREMHSGKFQWEAYDLHSGLFSLRWRLVDNYTKDELLVDGISGHQGFTNESDCNSYHQTEDCYCVPPIGCFHKTFNIDLKYAKFKSGKELTEHNYDLYFEITAVNNAQLKTIDTIKITVDTSPPHAGSVHIGQVDEEVSFQVNTLIRGHWQGFIDQESHIRFYKYKFDRNCSSIKDFHLSNHQDETSLTSVEWTAPHLGVFYLTVVAYNHGLNPSPPVCSAPIVVDKSGPHISFIRVQHAKTRSGLMKNSGALWLVSHNREKQGISEASELCLQHATEISDPGLLPDQPSPRNVPNYQKTLNDSECQILGGWTSQSMLQHVQPLSVTFQADDPESIIQDFDLMIGEEKNSEFSLVETSSGSQNFVVNDLNLHERKQFHLRIIVRNKAGLSSQLTSEKFFLDFTAPVSSDITPEDISIQHSDSLQKLKINVPPNIFVDEEDPFNLDYYFALSTDTIRPDISGFNQMLPNSECFNQNQIHCVQFGEEMSSLNLPKRFSVILKVKNTVGLESQSVVGIVKLENLGEHLGVVSIIDPIKNERISYQSDSERFKLELLDFHFNNNQKEHQLQIAVGEQNGQEDVFSIKDISFTNELDQYIFLDNLTLTNYKKYFVSVQYNSSQVKSQPVIIVPEGQIYSLQLKVGFDCLPNNQSENSLQQKTCFSSNYQSSLTSFHSHWIIPSDLEDKITQTSISLVDEESQNPPITTHILPGSQNSFTFTSILLIPGHQYLIFLQFHFGRISSGIHHSATVLISDSQPVPSSLQISLQKEDEKEKVKYEMRHFTVPDMMSHLSLKDHIHHYDWTIADSKYSSKYFHWSKLNVDNVDDTQISGIVDLNKQISDQTKCLYFLVRGFSQTGISAIAATKVGRCSQDVTQRDQNKVIDAKGEVDMPLNSRWNHEDIDYTSSTSSLAAVWPTLQHDHFDWALLQEMDVSSFQNQLRPIPSLDLPYPCDHPKAIKCGKVSNKQFLNIKDLQLTSGRRYYICIHANETIKRLDKFNKKLEAISVCSDGVTVLSTPPVGRTVSILGDHGSNDFTSSTNYLAVYFEEFEDNSNSIHHKSIAKYSMKLGTTLGAGDVLPYQEIGVNHHILLSNLSLQNGRHYFATIEGESHSGLTSTVSSPGILVDLKAPKISQHDDIIVGPDTGFLSQLDTVKISWTNVFHDPESGIAYFQWCIGREQGVCDISSSTVTRSDTVVVSLAGMLHDSHQYVINVQAVDKVGHRCVASSSIFSVDTTPPSAGKIYIGRKSSEWRHLLYLNHPNQLHAWWTPFIDPHSDHVMYEISVGSCRNCEDTLSPFTLGVREAVNLSATRLIEGKSYYVNVKGCNMADLCSTASSNAFVLDTTPPVAGFIQDGLDEEDLELTTKSDVIEAKLIGFHDPESSLERIQWCLGHSSDMCDIVSEQNTESLTFQNVLHINLKSLQLSLPTGRKIFLRIKVTNRADLSTWSSSNGFVIDKSPPIFSRKLEFNLEQGSIKPHSQIFVNSASFSWSINSSSPIEDQFISIQPISNSQTAPKHHKIQGDIREVTLTDLHLRDGFSYEATIRACSWTKLCAISKSSRILVDSSPPHVGRFAIATNHAIQTYSNRLTWSRRSVNLSVSEFIDPHSGLFEYHVFVGSDFMQTDLANNETFPHNEHETVQNFSVKLEKDLTIGKQIFVHLLATNKVGLRSHLLHAAFTLSPNGSLDLVRRCQAHSCQGDCDCASLHDKCKPLNLTCLDVSEQEESFKFTVVDKVELQDMDDDSKEVDFTTESCTLSATWKEANLDRYLRFEVSGGLASYHLPSGLFDSKSERVWFDVGKSKFAILTLDKSSQKDEFCMKPNMKYKFFVRAWLSEDRFVIHTSDGLIFLNSPPSFERIRGIAVREYITENTKDIDFLPDGVNTLSVAFLPKSRAGLKSSIKKCSVKLGRRRFGGDIAGPVDLSPGINSHQFSDLQLEHSTQYYTTVCCTEHTRLHACSTSNGFIMDQSAPQSGRVFDTEYGIKSIDYQNSTERIAAYWDSFWDAESFIHHYMWCVGESSHPEECRLSEWKNMGVATHSVRILNQSMKIGTVAYNKIYAVNGAGIQSSIVVSTGVRVDTTPPILLRIQSTNSSERSSLNICKNGNFKSQSSHIQKSNGPFLNSNWWKNVTNLVPESWTLDNWFNRESRVVSYQLRDAQMSSSIIETVVVLNTAALSQILKTNVGQVYQLIVVAADVSEKSGISTSNQLVIHIGEMSKTYRLHKHSNLVKEKKIDWNQFKMYFVAKSENTKFQIVSGVNQNLALERVEVHEIDVSEASESSTSLSVSLKTSRMYSSVSVTWLAADPESGISDIYVAIGTMIGGVQIQPFISLPPDASSFQSKMFVQPHGTPIHVSILMVNRAGLFNVNHYRPDDPPRVDFTPPQIHIQLRNFEGESCEDWKFCPIDKDEDISLDITVKDEESELNKCEIAFGSSLDSAQYFVPFQSLPLSSNVKSDRIHFQQKLSNLDDKEKLYPTVRCHNLNGHLNIKCHPSGFLLIKRNISSFNNHIQIRNPSSSYFDRIDPYIGSRSIIISVNDFLNTEYSIKQYEYRVNDGQWSSLGQANIHLAKIEGLPVDHSEYKVSIRAVNHLGEAGPPITKKILIDQVPERSGDTISVTLNSKTSALIDWSAVFLHKEKDSLRYEITLGSMPGQGDLIFALSTLKSQLMVNKIDSESLNYLGIAAISPAGFVTSARFQFVGSWTKLIN